MQKHLKMSSAIFGHIYLTHKLLEKQGSVISTEATFALVLKDRLISSYSADENIHCIGPVLCQHITTTVKNIRK